MPDQRRRLAWYLAIVTTMVVIYAVVYQWGMATFEGRPRGLVHSFEIVVQSFTTTGYGEDAPWATPQMQALMIAMQLTGISAIFLALPLFVAPWVDERFSTTVPTAVDGYERHIVVCEFTARGEALIEELRSWDREYVVIESDRDRVETIRDRGMEAIHGNPESAEDLMNACVADAAAVVADASDERNASIVLSIREVTDDARVVALAEDEAMVEYLYLAGADAVFSPRQLLGESLANEVTTAVSMELGDTIEVGADFEVVEIPIQSGCAVFDTRLADSGIREKTGANVLGLWQRGEFVPAPDPDTRLDEDTILLAAGSASQLSALKRLTLSDVMRRARGTVIIAGYGEVGAAVSSAIAASEMRGVVVALEDRPGVDVVGDVTDEDTLREAGIRTADSLILALSDDTTTMLATLVARDLKPDLNIVARAEEAESVPKVYRAGADYVLALAIVSGRMIGSALIEEEEVIAPVKQIEIVRATAPAFAGQTLAGADIRSRTGCTVVAVERNGEVMTDMDPTFTIEPDDTIIVAGTDEGINRFSELAK